jgi:hemerythrin
MPYQDYEKSYGFKDYEAKSNFKSVIFIFLIIVILSSSVVITMGILRDHSDHPQILLKPEVISNTQNTYKLDALDQGESWLIYWNHPNHLSLEVWYHSTDGFEKPIFIERTNFIYPYASLPGDINFDYPILVKGESIFASTEVWASHLNHFVIDQNSLSAYLLFTLGILFGMIILNLVLGIYMRDRYFILHGLYLACALLFSFYYSGLSNMLIQEISFTYFVWSFTGYGAMLIFAYSYLGVKDHLKSLKFVYLPLIFLNLGFGILAIFGFHPILYKASMILGLIIPLLILASLIYMTYHKKNVSLYFLFGGSFLGLALIILILQQMGLVANINFTKYFFYYALALESLFFTLGILDQLKNLNHYNQLFFNLAVTDPLTGLNNRHYLEIHKHTLLSYADRYQEPFALLILDIDHFKYVNDTYGHDFGDEILKMLATILRKRLRKSDMLMRWGGEEFLIILPKSSLSQATEVGDIIRDEVSKSSFDKIDHLTISVGVAQWQEGESFEDTFGRADQAMYASKDDGRNKVSANFNPLNSSVIWKSLYRSGHETIDDEHEALYNALQDLSRHMNKDTFKEALKDLIDMTRDHFKSEEAFLKESDYNELKKHAHIHEELLKKAYKIYHAYEAGQENDEEKITFVINTLIMGHLVSEDLKFYESLESK